MTGAELAIIGLVATGTGLQAYSQYEAGKQAATQAKIESAWQSYNAKVLKMEAEAEKRAAAFEAKQQRRESKQFLARQRALIGASGVEVAGSPLLVEKDTAAQLALENINIRLAGRRRVKRYESESILETSKAQASRMAAKRYKRAGMIGAGASLLRGAGEVGYMGYKMGYS